jgi:hypothetical protein
MKEIAKLTIRQDPDEPRLTMRIYRGNSNIYIRIESQDPRIPVSMPMRIKPTNFKDAKKEAEKFLYLVRGVLRQALGKTPDLPANMKEIESELPAFLFLLLDQNFLGQN